MHSVEEARVADKTLTCLFRESLQIPNVNNYATRSTFDLSSINATIEPHLDAILSCAIHDPAKIGHC